MALYEIRYAILPAGVGPDDYESSDLEDRTEILELADPDPAGILDTGMLITYGPDMRDVHDALADRIPPGARPIVLRMELRRD